MLENLQIDFPLKVSRIYKSILKIKEYFKVKVAMAPEIIYSKYTDTKVSKSCNVSYR